MIYTTHIVREEKGREVCRRLDHGFRPVRLPEHPDLPLWLVVVRGLGEKPMMLLTNLSLRKNRKALWWVVSASLIPSLVDTERRRPRPESAPRRSGRGRRYGFGESYGRAEGGKRKRSGGVVLAAPYLSRAGAGAAPTAPVSGPSSRPR